MVYLEVGLMAITNYYDRRNTNSQQVDIRDRYFRPLLKYGIREAHCSRELRYDDPTWYYSRGYVDSSINDFYRPKENTAFEIKLDKEGLEAMMYDLDRIDHEEWLRKNNPSLQAAWDHYQTVLGLVK